MARGNFSTSLYASLSRTQVKFGGPATFGLEIARADYAYDPASPDHSNGNIEKQSSFRLGRMIERGCFNYRWPVNEYYLDLHEQHRSFRHKKRDIDVKQTATTATVDSEHLTSNADEDYLENHVGTCQMFSFAMDSMFYQVLRIEEGGHIEDGDHVQSGIIDQTSSRDFPAESQVLLTMLGPLWLRSFDVHDRLRDHNLTKREKVFHPILPYQRNKLTTPCSPTNAKLSMSLQHMRLQRVEKKLHFVCGMENVGLVLKPESTNIILVKSRISNTSSWN
jgi:hypothetical protein